MENIFYSIIKADCQEISSSLNDNGLLEFTIPKNCTNEELSKYFHNLGEEEHSKIVKKQKKAKKVFRKKVQEMIDKYEKEFNFDLCINLRFLNINKTKKLNDCKVEVHGILFEGHLSILSTLQYFPDELVEKIIRGTVFTIACEYEDLCIRIKYTTVGGFEFPDGKYRISVPDDSVTLLGYMITYIYCAIF